MVCVSLSHTHIHTYTHICIYLYICIYLWNTTQLSKVILSFFNKMGAIGNHYAIMLNEIRQSQKDKNTIFSLICGM